MRFCGKNRFCLGMTFLFFLGGNPVLAGPIDVVASFSILADITRQIGAERVRVYALVGNNADAHVYQPTPADAKIISRARLVIVNGLGFEGWIDRLIKSSGYRGRILVASNGVKTLALAHEDKGHHNHHGDIDPHAWQDPVNALRYADNIATALGETDPEGKAFYQHNAERYKRDIRALDNQLRKTFSAIASEKRKLVTSHAAFGYFGRAYGLYFISPVGLSTDAEVSAAHIGNIIQLIRRERIPAVFMENISDPRLLERIRTESGATIGGTLYADALSGRDGPAATYLDMMRYNSKSIAKALSK